MCNRDELDGEAIRRFAKRNTEASFRLSGRVVSDLQDVEQLEYGSIVPGVRCPECGNELVHTSNGALCDWCSSYVPVVGSAVHVKEDEDDEPDWTDDEE